MKQVTLGEIEKVAIDLLESGDDTGCDGTVVVGEKEFHALRKLVRDWTGQNHGNVEEPTDESTAEAPEQGA